MADIGNNPRLPVKFIFCGRLSDLKDAIKAMESSSGHGGYLSTNGDSEAEWVLLQQDHNWFRQVNADAVPSNG